MPSSIVGICGMGLLSHTKYILHNSPLRVQVIRRRHPLFNQELEVLKADNVHLTVVLPDCSAMKTPRAWTNADGAMQAPESSISSVFTVDALRDILTLVGTLRNRI